jgi:hypothetical protein
VSALFWASLAVFLVALIGGIAYCAVVGLRSWRVFRRAAGSLTGALEERLSQAEALADRAERVAGRTEEVLDSVARLRRSIARARVLLVAFGEVSSILTAVRRLVPVK